VVAGVDATNEPGRWPSDAVSEYPDAGARVFASVRVGTTDGGDGIACLRKHPFSETPAEAGIDSRQSPKGDVKR
jgi:hypothetical protein